MLVYGDMARREDAREVRAAIAALLHGASGTPAGLGRHSLLVEAFIRASEAVGSIVDAGWAERGFDAPSRRENAGLALVCALAELVGRSWDNGFAVPEGRIVAAAGMVDAGIGISGNLLLRQAEGFAIYALYPETFWEAARRSGLSARTRTVGIRSIGLALGAVVSAALAAPPPVTLRPFGHPFGRRVEAPGLRDRLLSGGREKIAIVDEGPGLSGSSFAAAARWLHGGGVEPGAIRFFPSHDNGPGPHASAQVRAVWDASPRVWRSFEDTILDAAEPQHRLERWAAGLVGPLDAPLEEISGGRWRAHVSGGAAMPAIPQRERRKFLARAKGDRFLLKFAGLGLPGRRKLAAAQALHAAGFCAEPVGLCHGMLVERWIDGLAVPAEMGREKPVARLGAYLGFRARHLRAVNEGASGERLREMACFNAGQALGTQAAAKLDAFFGRAGQRPGAVRRVDTDNRLHRWEWLLDRNGVLLKTDALDHSSDHDLIGCQDIAWDIAGAVVEWDLNEEQAEALRCAVSDGAGTAVGRETVAWFLPCYLAYQLGLWTMALHAAPGGDAARPEGERKRYADRFTAWLAGSPA